MTDEPDKYGRERRAGPRASRCGTATGSTRRSGCCATSPGVTVLIYDQQCAAEKRRLRKRGKLPEPADARVHQRGGVRGLRRLRREVQLPVSVQPVETEFGRKTQIHQSSCNKDYSCLRGDCPSFLTVVPLGRDQEEGSARRYTVDRALPEPALTVPRDANIFMMGIGGTGVVTVNQVLGTAALLDGKHRARPRPDRAEPEGRPGRLAPARSPSGRRGRLEQGGRRRRPTATWASTCWWRPRRRTSIARRADRTIAVVSTSQVPTGAMVHAHRRALPRRRRAAELDQSASPARTTNVYLDALGLAEALFGDHMAANMLVLGAAYQAGAHPGQRRGHRAGHRAQRRRGGDEHAGLPGGPAARRRSELAGDGQAAPPGRGRRDGARARRPQRARWSTGSAPTGELRRLLEIRVPELIAYQDARYAASYVDFVRPRAGGRAGGGARRDAAERGRRALPLQADGLQGRVRGGAAAPAGRPRRTALAEEFPAGRARAVQPAPADAAGPGLDAEDQARLVVRRRLPRCWPG